jgi:hypothetical protein
MINTLNDSLITISIPVTASDRQRIELLARSQTTPEKKDRVYRNALAVLVTHRYLQLLAIASDLEASDSWNPASQHPGNIADLYISEKNERLECRCIKSTDTKCFIPEEVWGDRLGYVVVQLDEPYLEGIVLGFVPQVSVTELPLSYLQPLDALIDCLIPEPTPIWQSLSQWLKGIFEPDWEPLAELIRPAKMPVVLFSSRSPLNPETINKNIRDLVKQLYINQANENLSQSVLDLLARDPEFALVQLIQTTQNDEIRWQAAELLAEINPEHPAGAVRNAKDLGMYLAGHTVALMVGVLPKPDGKMLILARVYPVQQKPHLPTGLQLAGIDDAGNSFFEIQARLRDDSIQFKFTADPGDRFTLRVSLDNTAISENFIV